MSALFTSSGEWLIIYGELLKALVAQLVEHFLGKEEVTDSSSVEGSILPFLDPASNCHLVALCSGSKKGRIYARSSIGRATDSKSNVLAALRLRKRQPKLEQ